jgi:transposase InsO family protein
LEKTRRDFTPQQKVAILREHLVEQVPVSDLCDKHKLHPTVFYQWQKGARRGGRGTGAHWLEEWEKDAILDFHHRSRWRAIAGLPSGTFVYLRSLLDGCSRAIVHWELRESMTEAHVEIILQRGLEKYPHAKPRIISDNGPQFIARDFQGVYPHRRSDPCAHLSLATENSSDGTSPLGMIVSAQESP